MTITTAIIEDDADTRSLFAGWLHRAEGFECVAEYADAESALAGLPALRPQVILSDINLPGLNGTECVRQLKPLLPDSQFLMITVYEDADHIFAALSAGAAGYLLKRTARVALLTAIREVHEGGPPITASIARKVVQSFQRPAAPSIGGIGKKPQPCSATGVSASMPTYPRGENVEIS